LGRGRAFSQDGERVVSAGAVGTIAVYNAAGGSELLHFENDDPANSFAVP